MDVFNAFEGDTNPVKIQTLYLEYFPSLKLLVHEWSQPEEAGAKFSRTGAQLMGGSYWCGVPDRTRNLPSRFEF
jgi:hypothetical protein